MFRALFLFPLRSWCCRSRMRRQWCRQRRMNAVSERAAIFAFVFIAFLMTVWETYDS